MFDDGLPLFLFYHVIMIGNWNICAALRIYRLRFEKGLSKYIITS